MLQSNQFDVLVLPGTIAGTWYDCDIETHQAYGEEFDSYEEAVEACLAAGFVSVCPKGYMGWVAID
jgi:hypothetical protein